MASFGSSDRSLSNLWSQAHLKDPLKAADVTRMLQALVEKIENLQRQIDDLKKTKK